MVEKQTQKKLPPKQLLGINIVGKIVGLFVVIWLISVSYFAFIFFAIGMLPAILAHFVDRSSARFASKTVSAFNFVGILPFLMEIALTVNRSLVVQRMMTDLSVWGTVYLTASVGWLMVWSLPQISQMLYLARANAQILRLEREQKEIEEEWGEEVTQPLKGSKPPAKKEDTS